MVGTKKKEKKVIENGDDGNFSDPEDFVDDISDEELMGDVLARKPLETDGTDSVVVVDNVPQVEGERQTKLLNVLRKIFSKFGTIVTEHFPVDEAGKTKGYIFIEFENAEQALEAVKATNGYKLDKAHIFAVNLFTDFEKYSEVDEDDGWEPPQPAPFVDHGNMLSWLQDKTCYDQFSVIYDNGQTTGIYLNTHNEPTKIEERGQWTETYVRWSPKGTYLATFHSRGIALWGGEKFKQIQRFSHQGVHFIDFSPCEKYLVTFSPSADSKDDPKAIIIWDILTGQKKRGFHCENASAWPIFKWSFDGKYFARMSPNTLSVYETPSFGLLDKKSLTIEGLKDFAWSPTDPYIVYWTPEVGHTPARMVLIEMPSRVLIQQKNLVMVADCKLHWQRSGDFLCVKVDRFKKKEEKENGVVKFCGVFHSFNIFRMREKDIPIDTVEVKESIQAFAWEPVGSKFAIIHGEAPRIAVSIYGVNAKGSVISLELLKTLDKRTCNGLFWSPRGRFLVLAALGGMQGEVEFIDTEDMSTMNKGEHFQATDVEWDPTGRYVVTGASFWGGKAEHAYWIWSFQGKLLHKQLLTDFCQLLWRPRPPSLLDDTALKNLKKNMKKYHATFALEDKMRESKASKEQIERRQAAMDEYAAWRRSVLELHETEAPERWELRKGLNTDALGGGASGEDVEEESIEFLVNVQESIIEDDDSD